MNLLSAGPDTPHLLGGGEGPRSDSSVPECFATFCDLETLIHTVPLSFFKRMSPGDTDELSSEVETRS